MMTRAQRLMKALKERPKPKPFLNKNLALAKNKK